MFLVDGSKLDFLDASADVHSFPVMDELLDTIIDDVAVFTDVDDTEFSSIEEVFGSEFWCRTQDDFLVDGNDATEDDSIDVGIGKMDIIDTEDILD